MAHNQQQQQQQQHGRRYNNNNNNNNHVRRRLFVGDCDSEALIDNTFNLLQEEMKASNEEAKRRWNFDFENEVPLQGDWEWEKVEETAKNEEEEADAKGEEGDGEKGDGKDKKL